jgi:hypothetical protein
MLRPMIQIKEIILSKKIQGLIILTNQIIDLIILINQIIDLIQVDLLELIQEEQNQENSSVNLNIKKNETKISFNHIIIFK